MARSKFIDAYNAADAAVRSTLSALGHEPKQLLSQNIEQLSKLPAAPNFSKERKNKIAAHLQELRKFQGARCDIVHGIMEVLTIDGVDHAFFANVQKQAQVGRTGLLLTPKEMQECCVALLRIATQLGRPAFAEVTKMNAAAA